MKNFLLVILFLLVTASPCSGSLIMSKISGEVPPSCPALSGNSLQEDFSGAGLPAGWDDDANVQSEDYDNTTNPPLTNECFAGQQFFVNNSNDYWTRSGSMGNLQKAHTEEDIYISAESLGDGQNTMVLAHNTTDAEIRLAQASSTLYFECWFNFPFR